MSTTGNKFLDALYWRNGCDPHQTLQAFEEYHQFMNELKHRKEREAVLYRADMMRLDALAEGLRTNVARGNPVIETADACILLSVLERGRNRVSSPLRVRDDGVVRLAGDDVVFLLDGEDTEIARFALSRNLVQRLVNLAENVKTQYEVEHNLVASHGTQVIETIQPVLRSGLQAGIIVTFREVTG